jgi:hypothetical protein
MVTALPVNFSGGFVEIGAYIGTATNGWFWILIGLIVPLIISIVFLMEFGFVRATAMSLFWISLLAFPLRFLGYIGDFVLFIFIILACVMGWILYATSE